MFSIAKTYLLIGLLLSLPNDQQAWMPSLIRKPFETVVGIYPRLRKDATEDMCTYINKLEASGRLERKRRFDVYLPKPAPQDHALEAVFFVPGLAVEHCAYGRIAHLLSEEGYLVVVASAEPFRLASEFSGFKGDFLKKKFDELSEEFGPINKWHLGGHSLGAFLSSRVARDLDIEKLIMIAAAPGFVNYMGNLSDLDIELLVLKGDCDGFAQAFPGSEGQQNQFCSNMPKKTKTLEIDGGTHHGFGDYKVPQPEATNLTKADQQLKTVAHIKRFLESDWED